MNPPFWATRAGVLAVALLWGAVHGGLRFAASQTIGIDDVSENLLAQTLAWGYEARQPPLYTWLLWAAQQAGGYGLGPFLVIKYALLTVMALSVHAVALRATPDARLAALTAFSMSALYQIGWNVHEGVTHTVVLSAAIPLSVLALARLTESPSTPRAAAFGAALAMGLLAKHGFWATAALLVFAAAVTPEVREKLRARDLVVSATVAAALYAPYALWLVAGGGSLLSVAIGTLASAPTPWVLATLRAMAAPLLFLAPLSAIGAGLIVLAPMRSTAPLEPWARFCRAMTLAAAAALVVAAAAGVLTSIKERHLHALFLMAPVWLWAEIGRRWPRPPVRVAGAALLATAALVVAVRLPGFLAPEPESALVDAASCAPTRP